MVARPPPAYRRRHAHSDHHRRLPRTRPGARPSAGRARLAPRHRRARERSIGGGGARALGAHRGRRPPRRRRRRLAPRRPRGRRGRRASPARQQRQRARPEPPAVARDLPAGRARTRLPDQRPRAARADPARAAGARTRREDPQPHLRRGRRGLRGLGRLRLVQGRARADQPHPGRRAARAARLCGRPRRHEYASAPGGVPRRGHLRPPAARGQRAGPPGADRRRPRERALRRPRGGAGVSGALAFELTARNEAGEPPEARGLRRDEVRLLVTAGEALRHARFLDLPSLLGPGDLLVVNASATLPAALDATRASGERVALHLSTPLPGDGPAPVRGGDVAPHWVVELRSDNHHVRDAHAGEILALPAGGHARLVAPYLSAGRLWVAALAPPAPLSAYLAEHGRPIAYRHTNGSWPLRDYQSIFATEPGSAEMPSAGRPFSRRLLRALEARGVRLAKLVLHTGVSSLERGERPYPERFRIPGETAAAVNAAKRTIAVGTTVVRALETVAAADGTVAAAEGWTRLVVTPERGVRAVDGLITGWHEPDASHLLMLEAIAGREAVAGSYATALERGYLWHEFGDSHLLLRDG